MEDGWDRKLLEHKLYMNKSVYTYMPVIHYHIEHFALKISDQAVCPRGS